MSDDWEIDGGNVRSRRVRDMTQVLWTTPGGWCYWRYVFLGIGQVAAITAHRHTTLAEAMRMADRDLVQHRRTDDEQATCERL